ncbi:MAG: transporter [Prevotellaceae bacterium]|nr:transporter [Prevotellaceae bacterium]
MKQKLNWKMVLLFLFVAGGLYYITSSFLMSLGILLLLFVADYAVQDLAQWWKNKK